MPRVLVPLAQGCEEIEAVTVIDLLRRAGIEVTTAGLTPGPVRASRGVTLVPDTTLDDARGEQYDMVVLPGGAQGAKNLEADPRIAALLRTMAHAGKFICAVGAAPVVLAKAGLLGGKRATGYPGFLEQLDLADVTVTGEAVTVDGAVITSRGPGTAMDFALALVEALVGRETRDRVEQGLVRD